MERRFLALVASAAAMTFGAVWLMTAPTTSAGSAPAVAANPAPAATRTTSAPPPVAAPEPPQNNEPPPTTIAGPQDYDPGPFVVHKLR